MCGGGREPIEESVFTEQDDVTAAPYGWPVVNGAVR